MTVELEQFFSDIWGENEGTVCLSFKTTGGFRNEFFKWSSRDRETTLRSIRSSIGKAAGSDDCYFVPSLLRGESRKKIAFKTSQVVWADFDSGLPELPLEPTLLVQTSEGRYHAYWKLDQVCSSPNELEKTNKALAESLGADMSGWDSTQLLRVPGTISKKRDQPVVIISRSENSYSLDAFPKALAQHHLSSERRVLSFLKRFSGFRMIQNLLN